MKVVLGKREEGESTVRILPSLRARKGPRTVQGVTRENRREKLEPEILAALAGGPSDRGRPS